MSISFSYTLSVLSPGNSYEVSSTSEELQCFSKHELSIHLWLCICELLQMFCNANAYSILKNPTFKFPYVSFLLSLDLLKFFFPPASQCFCIPFWCNYFKPCTLILWCLLPPGTCYLTWWKICSFCELVSSVLDSCYQALSHKVHSYPLFLSVYLGIFC